MLAEVISFGGRWKNVTAVVRERLRRLQQIERRKEEMRLKVESDVKTVLVQIKLKQRDNEETVPEVDKEGKKTGKMVKNDRYGKFYYTSVDGGSFELEQTTPEEVRAVVKEAILRASKK